MLTIAAIFEPIAIDMIVDEWITTIIKLILIGIIFFKILPWVNDLWDKICRRY